MDSQDLCVYCILSSCPYARRRPGPVLAFCRGQGKEVSCNHLEAEEVDLPCLRPESTSHEDMPVSSWP